MLLRLVAGFAAGTLLDWPWSLLCLPPLCSVWPWSMSRARAWVLPVALAIVCGGWHPRAQPAELPQLPSGHEVRVAAWVASRPDCYPQSGSCRALVQVTSLSDSSGSIDGVRGSQLLLRSRQAIPAYGTRIRFDAVFEPPRARRHFRGFAEHAFLRARNAWGSVYAREIELLPGVGGSVWRRRLVEPLRSRLRDDLRATLQGIPEGLSQALLLGIRSDLDDRLEESWRALGMSHVLALSGMHVGVVAAGLLTLAGSVRTRRGLAVVVLGVFGYAALGGLGASVLRAAVMVAAASLAVYCGRGRHPLRNLGFTAMLLVLLAPERLHDLGFQLSCSATLGILLVVPSLARWALGQRQRGLFLRVLAWAVPIAALGIAAQIVTLPWILFHFGMVSWMSPLANLVLTPVVDAALVLGLAGAAASLLLPPAARPLWMLSGALLFGVGWVSVRTLDVMEPRVFLRAEPWVVACAAMASLAFVSGMASHRRRRTLALVVCAACLLVTFVGGTRSTKPSWQIDMIDIGQGDAFLLRRDDRTWLFDGGPTRPFDQGARTVLPHLRKEGIDRLQAVVVSHPHLDHYGGIGAILEAVPVDSVFVAQASWEHEVFAGWRRQFASVPQRGLQSGDVLHFDAHTPVNVLWPPADDVLRSGANGVSLVMWIRPRQGPHLLCMGDLEDDGEHELLQVWGDSLRAHAQATTILKAGHHGSDTSSTAAFLDVVDAEVALISAGRRNRYGHPAPETLQALQQRGCVILRTDAGGDIRIEQRGRALWLQRPAARAHLLLAPGAGIDADP